MAFGLGKGIAELDKNGNPCTTRVRMTKNDKVIKKKEKS